METDSSTGPASDLDQMAEILVGEEKEDEESTTEGEESEAEETDDSGDSGDTEDDFTAEGEAQEDEEVTWGKALGVSDDQLELDEDGNLTAIKVKVDGEVSSVKMQDLIAGYQTQKYNTQKSQALSEEIKKVEETKSLITTEYTKKLTDLQELSKYLQQSFLREYQDVDWQRLRVENPAEYAAAIQDYQLKEQEVNKIFTALETERVALQQKTVEEQQAKQQEVIKTQVEKVLDNNPEWRDPEKFKVALEEMVDFVGQSYGFTSEEFQQIQDARLIELIKDAQRYRKGQTIAKQKLAKPLPKFQKAQTKPVNKLSKLEQLTKRAAKATGAAKRTAETDAVAELLNTIGGL